MDEKLIRRLLAIVTIAFGVAAIIFILISMFDADASWALPTGLGCVVAGLLFNVLNTQMGKKDK